MERMLAQELLSYLLAGPTGLVRRQPSQGETTMWTKPEYTELRFGFEVTMYIANR